MPHVAGRQGNNLPTGEGCWLCGMNTVEQAELIHYANDFTKRLRSKRSVESEYEINRVEDIPVEPTVVTIDFNSPEIREQNRLVTILPTHKSEQIEKVKLYGIGSELFYLETVNNEVTLKLNRALTSSKSYKLVILIETKTDTRNPEVVFIPLELIVLP